GNGAGGRPEVGKASADEAADELARHLEDVHMVFITAGMGGGTGTGAAPVIARMARERNILTVGVVTKPFAFEGKKRMRSAEEGINELQAYVDTLIVIPNQNLFKVANERTGWKEAFEMADNVLYMGVRGVTDLMVLPGIVNLDYADIRSVMSEMGKAMMGTGEAEGEERAIRAAEAAISNPLLEDTNMKGARGLLINITGGSDVTLFEVDQAAHRIGEEVDKDANIMFGMSLDESLAGRIRVSVVATGIDSAASQGQQLPKLQVVNGGSAEAVGFPAHAQPGPAQHGGPQMHAAPQMNAAPLTMQPAMPQASRHAGYVPEPPASPLLSKAYTARSSEELAFGEPGTVPQAPAPRPAPPVRATAAPEPARAPEPTRGASIFKSVFGFGGSKPAPAASSHRQEPAIHAEPAPAPQPEPSRAAVRPAQIDEIGLEIPAFMRRNNP
ncbi:MAG: cell division protein FtsZ, partial [Acidocella sp. 20-61-6]